jgi:tocopherol cyclase
MNKSDIRRNAFMLRGPLARRGYDWWWHNFTGYSRSDGEPKAFFIEYFVCNPALGGAAPILGQSPANRADGVKP